ncbi:hypothetical protein PC122_g12817 [Phytophthora cactorum]|nr:hypothetical protein PC122_g12817 [Phytophthora cactorum]
MPSKVSTEVVNLSYWVFAVWWIIILAVHVVTSAYNALYAYCYWNLQDTFLNMYLESYQIGMPSPYHHTIAVVHVVMSLVHGVCILLMAGGSLWQRSLVFSPWPSSSSKTEDVKASRTNSVVLKSFSKVYDKISDRHGILGISGTLDKVQEKWREFDASTVVQLLIRHCPALEVPDIFSDFSGLRGIKVYNTTIVDWSDSAAITLANHPGMSSLILVRVNMTNGLLPAGLQSSDFPPTLYDIEICVTNLRTLPEDLDSKWPQAALIQVEYSHLTTVPAVLPRLQPYYLAVTGNPITELPPEIFEVDGMLYLGISEMNIHELPRNVTHLSSDLSWIFIGETSISFFWAWVDELVIRMKGRANPWLAGPTPYCDDFEKILNGTASAFRVPLLPEYSQTMMDPSEENRPVLQKSVRCDPTIEGLFYPLEIEDSINAISTPPPLVRYIG